MRQFSTLTASAAARGQKKGAGQLPAPFPIASAAWRLEAAARKLIEIANSVEAVQDGRIHIEKINEPFLLERKGSPAEHGAGLKLAIERGWLWFHESGTYVKFTRAGAEIFA